MTIEKGESVGELGIPRRCCRDEEAKEKRTSEELAAEGSASALRGLCCWGIEGSTSTPRQKIRPKTGELQKGARHNRKDEQRATSRQVARSAHKRVKGGTRKLSRQGKKGMPQVESDWREQKGKYADDCWRHRSKKKRVTREGGMSGELDGHAVNRPRDVTLDREKQKNWRKVGSGWIQRQPKGYGGVNQRPVQGRTSSAVGKGKKKAVLNA